jgi:hypothetical protein
MTKLDPLPYICDTVFAVAPPDAAPMSWDDAVKVPALFASV